MKYYQAPRWSNEILDCSMPMTFDTYNKCSFNCMYCFSFFQKSHDNSPNAKTGHKEYQRDQLTWVNPEKVKKLFRGELPKSQFNDFIKNRMYMQWGGLADQFDNYERQEGISLELLKFFDEIKYPLSFSTKSTWWTKDDRYMSLIKKNPQWHFKFSIINLNEEKAKQIEQGVPSPDKRLKAMQRVAKLGNPVTLFLVISGLILYIRRYIL